MKTDCPFCNLPESRVSYESRYSLAFMDGFPVADHHTLVIPRRHVASIFELPEEELKDIWSAVTRVRELLRKNYAPDAFNIGINDGEAAGQTIPHAHVHVIPRHKGDVPDPRGGVRWIIPGKAKYW